MNLLTGPLVGKRFHPNTRPLGDPIYHLGQLKCYDRSSISCKWKNPFYHTHEQEPVVNKQGIFISYSHRDRRWLERLQVHLKPLIRDLDIVVWDDNQIKAGTKRKEEIKQAINNAKVAVLLISADFMASDFISSNELPRILANAKNNGTSIIPVILSASWFSEDKNLGQYQAANKTSRPLNQLSKAQQEKDLYHISLDISSHFKH